MFDKQTGLQGLAEHARARYQNIVTLRAELGETEVTGQSGDGRVKVTLRGTGQAVSVHIDPDAVDPHDVARLEQLLVAAMDDAQQAIRTFVEEKTRSD